MMRHLAHPLALLILAALAGCADEFHDPRLAAGPDPWALTVEVTVVGDDRSADALTHTGLYVLQPDRMVRVSLDGSGTLDKFPPPVADLNREQMRQVDALVRDNGLMTEPGSARAKAIEASRAAAAATQAATMPAGATPVGARSSSQVYYRVSITDRGKTHRYVTTPEESPGTVKLLRFLAQAAHVEPMIPATRPQ